VEAHERDRREVPAGSGLWRRWTRGCRGLSY
jgi:hypothetical protein